MLRLVPVLLASLAKGYDTDGHSAAAIIAGYNIDQKTTVKFLEETIPLRGQDVPRSLAFHSLWADQMTYKADYAWSKNLHFAQTSDWTCNPFSSHNDCPDGRCIVTAIANYTMRASDITLPLIQRQEAVKFLIHFMADLHQPVHVGFEENDGGNAIWITNRFTTLHNVWDETIFEYYRERQRQALKVQGDWNYYDAAIHLKKEIELSQSQNKDQEDLFSEDDVRSLARTEKIVGSIVSWVTQHYTCPIAYRHLDKRRIVYGDSLQDDWLKSRSKALTTLLKRAGLRLATLLDAIAVVYFDKKNIERARLQEIQRKEREECETRKRKAKEAALPKNVFSALGALHDDSTSSESCDEEERVERPEEVVGKLTQEDIDSLEKISKISKRKKTKPPKPISKMSNQEFDQQIREYEKEQKAKQAAKLEKERLKAPVLSGRDRSETANMDQSGDPVVENGVKLLKKKKKNKGKNARKAPEDGDVIDNEDNTVV